MAGRVLWLILICLVESIKFKAVDGMHLTEQHVIKRACHPQNVQGVTHTSHHIFVVCMADNHIRVFHSQTFHLLQNISLPGLINPWDAVFLDEANMLYIDDMKDGYLTQSNNPKRVWYANVNDLNAWLWFERDVYDEGSLSLVTEGRQKSLMTINSRPTRLQIRRPNGALIREIQLSQEVIKSNVIMAAVQVPNVGFAVSYATSNKEAFVGLFDDSGHVIRSIGGYPGSGPGQFREILDMFVGRTGLIFLADCYNSRLLVVKGTDLSLVDMDGGIMNQPLRLSYDEQNDQLYVASGQNIAVYHIVY
jgi:hypothetical protein